MKNVLLPLAKGVLITLDLMAAVSAKGGAIQKKTNESVQVRGVSKTLENKTKEQSGGFLDILTGKLVARLLGNLLAGKAKVPGRGVITTGEETIRAGQDFPCSVIF